MKAAVIGGGSWGSAFALHLGRQNIPTYLWIREADIFEEAQRYRENKTFLPGAVFPPAVTFSNDLRESVTSCEIVFVAVPSQFFRNVFTQLQPLLSSEQTVVSLTKGIEENTLKRMSEVMTEVFSPQIKPKLAVLSGPSFAREVAESHPTAVVVASENLDLAKKVQVFVSGSYFRSYTSDDVLGVELAGSLKNVIALAAGISDGLQFGDNSRAALITRGLAEITRLGQSLGAKKETFAGLAGVGDLVLTCTGKLSRNHFVGYEIGQGKRLEDIVSRMKMIAEGIRTTLSGRQLSMRERVEMPIFEQAYLVLYKNKDPRTALQDLMSRKLKNE
ncbi:MAG: NAD(P)-dependent glycerol-3-phosphate dehydrogenase [Candidatus Aminicenantes bacterium]|nr:NAD(P)-dependent glycerol-3-phosphate dehydrogenase [Candidatus Aminicenantes bacterium]